MRDIIIAIDGYSSCGKSTLAKGIARRFKYRYVDTGAMYRAVALYCIRNGMLGEGHCDVVGIIAALPGIQIDFRYDAEADSTITYLNGENVEDEIRDVPVSRLVTGVSQLPEVRKVLVKQQQDMGKSRAVVMDGRDIGTRVFPNAELKLFITADPEVRAQRRLKQLRDNGINVDIQEVRNNLSQRDFDDVNKGEHPLRQAPDAILLDNTNISVAEQFEKAAALVTEAINRP